ncbi:pentapeptide repeat-containing protein [Streptomyces sp. NBC_01615]|uniref:pentapeptide repeat-containing protein n=1 Tax=Streptomyces sp. NBC_01615 TaxID=2975898 RepID=UPI00386AC9E0
MDAAWILTIFVIAFALTGLFLLLLWWPRITSLFGGQYLKGLHDAKEEWGARNEIRKILLQSAGGLLLVGTLVASAIAAVQAYRTFQTQQDTEITDRYTKAVDQLGSKDVSVRAAAIFALARISKDSERDRDGVAQVISTFVRANSKRPMPEEKEKRQQEVDRPRTDIDAAMSALGRRDMHGETRRLLLDDIYLPNANLRALKLPETRFNHANLAGLDATGASTDLRNVDLSEAELTCAKLSWADLSSLKLQGDDRAKRTNLQLATLVGADLRHVRLWGAMMKRANLDYAHLEGADLSDVTDLEASQLARVFVDAKTKLPEDLQKIKPYSGRGYQCWNQGKIDNPVNPPKPRDP